MYRDQERNASPLYQSYDVVRNLLLKKRNCIATVFKPLYLRILFKKLQGDSFLVNLPPIKTQSKAYR